MYRRYYRYDDMGQLSPKFPGTVQAPTMRERSKEPSKETIAPIQHSEGEIITPRKSKSHTSGSHHDNNQKEKPKSKSSGLLGNLGLGNLFGGNLFNGNLFNGNLLGGLFGDGLFKDGKILGRFQFDDILLGFLILMLLQDQENEDLLLLLALGYIFIGDGSVGLFQSD